MDFGKVGNNHTGYEKEIPTVQTGTLGKNSGINLSELIPGKIFSGEVVSVGKDKVLLRLDNGQTIQAGVNGDIQLSVGQLLAFLVKSNTGKQLAIKPMFDVNIQNSSVLKALENAGLPVNSQNAELVQLLMKEQMPIDRETIGRFLRQMALHPDTDVKTLVQLQKMGLPVTEGNIAKFVGYQNHEYRLSQEISNVALDISKLMGDFTKQENVLDMFGKLTDIVFTEGKESTESAQAALEQGGQEAVKESTDRGTILFKEGPVLYDNLKSNTMIQNNGEKLNNVQRQALENIETVVERFQGQESEMSHIVESLKTLDEEAKGMLQALADSSKTQPKTAQKQDVLSKLFAAFEMYEAAEKSMKAAQTAVNSSEYELPKEKLVQESRDKLENERNNVRGGQLRNDIGNELGQELRSESGNVQKPGILMQLDEDARATLVQKLQKAGADVGVLLQVKGSEIQPEELVRAVKELVREVQQQVQKQNSISSPLAQIPEKLTAVKELLQSKEFQTVLKAAIEEQLLLKPQELTKDSVKEYYEKLSQKMNQLTEFINQMGKEDTSVMKNTTAIKQNVEYINQLNQLYSYVQLPVKLTGQNVHSELYVMTNKKRLRSPGGAFTALLHLDMEVLGSMDIYITMEQKKVSTKFYLQREELVKFLEEHSEPFIKSLEEKGFMIKADFEGKPKEKDIVEEFRGSQEEEQVVSKYSFDIRT